MRNAIAIVLAFAAGVLLTGLWWNHRATQRAPASTPAVVAQPAGASSSDATDGDTAATGSEQGDDWPQQGPTPEQVIYAQPHMLREAIARLTPRVSNQPNLYLVAFAGDGGEDVFRNEAEYAAKLFTTRFGPSAHAIVLENHPATLLTAPLATLSNLDSVLGTLHGVMKGDDILVLYLTTHGDEQHDLLVDMDPLPLDQIGPEDVQDLFRAHAFPWKVVVVNACYSGGFVPDLAGPGTLVLTAARSDRSSFGCGSDSDATYFGKAWLIDGLNQTDDFIDAFRRAQAQISQWEQRDKLTPSLPQISIGAGIGAQLAAWRAHVHAGAAVPFTVPAPAPAASASQ